MKIQLSSTLPFTPVQLDAHHVQPRRAVGQLMGSEEGREYRTAVYEFRHSDDDTIFYQIDPNERVYLDEISDSDRLKPEARSTAVPEVLEWVPRVASVFVKPRSMQLCKSWTPVFAIALDCGSW